MASKSRKPDLVDRLQGFARENAMAGKGALSVMLVVTRFASEQTPPYDPASFLTPSGGQVARCGRSAVQRVLQEHRIRRVLAEEGGRTSRGSIDRMRAYVGLLNELADADLLDFEAIESWWVDRVKEYFATKPLRLRADSAKAMRTVITDLIGAAYERQKESPGMMIVGAVMQHLVGAKLSIALPNESIVHTGFSVADAPTGRRGDFVVSDAVIHVTTAPSESLIGKCQDNIAENFRPIIVTTATGIGGAEALATERGVADRIDIIEIAQFLTTNLYEWSSFRHSDRPEAISELVNVYNSIVSEVETDPSLRISFE